MLGRVGRRPAHERVERPSVIDDHARVLHSAVGVGEKGANAADRGVGEMEGHGCDEACTAGVHVIVEEKYELGIGRE